jgi:thymidylate kinase
VETLRVVGGSTVGESLAAWLWHLDARTLFSLDQDEPSPFVCLFLDDRENLEQRVILNQVPDHIVVLGDPSLGFVHACLLGRS